MPKLGLTSLLALSTLCFALPAVADDEPQQPPPLPAAAGSDGATATPVTIDSVHLRNGGLYRGRVTEIVPGDHVTVVVEKGETKRVPWAEVDRVIVASQNLPPPPTGSEQATPPLAAPMVGPRAHVRIRSSRSVILYRKPAGTNSWSQVCRSPCDQEVPIGDTYRITGNGVPASKEFRLEASPGSTVELAVDPPSTGGMLLGGFLGYGGAVTAYVGLLLALVGQANANDDCYLRSSFCEGRQNDGEELRNVGLVALGVGTAAAVGGILIFLSSAKTDITQASSGKGSNDAFVRKPTWRSTSTAAAAPAAFPVFFQGTF